MTCRYFDAGWCYAPEDAKNNSIQGGCFEPEYCATYLMQNKMTDFQPKPQTLKQKFEEIPELLDQVDALMEFYPLPTQVWRDIKKLMILSYDKGYSRGGYDTHMKYAGTD